MTNQVDRAPKRMGLRSPLHWIGGKFYSAPRIVAAFPAPELYDTYVEPFAGALHVLMERQEDKQHWEVANDKNELLVNFLMHVRDHAEELEQRCRSLPYSKILYYRYHKSLYDGTPLDPMEQAVRWFYVLRLSFRAQVTEARGGWKNSTTQNDADSYHSALDQFAVIQHRLRRVVLDSRDFEPFITTYSKPRVFMYVDPPYINTEAYYGPREKDKNDPMKFHKRLAAALNATPALVALSYYPHPLIDELYPADRWRRMTWTIVKHSQRSVKIRDRATEMLLMNYPPAEPPEKPKKETTESLWPIPEPPDPGVDPGAYPLAIP